MFINNKLFNLNSLKKDNVWYNQLLKISGRKKNFFNKGDLQKIGRFVKW